MATKRATTVQLTAAGRRKQVKALSSVGGGIGAYGGLIYGIGAFHSNPTPGIVGGMAAGAVSTAGAHAIMAHRNRKVRNGEMSATQADKRNKKTLKRSMNSSLVTGMAGAAYAYGDHHAINNYARNKVYEGRVAVSQNRPYISGGKVGTTRYKRGAHQWVTKTHAVEFHKSSRYHGDTSVDFSKVGHTGIHTTHHIGVAQLAGAAALTGAVAGGAYYYRKRKNGKQERVRKPKR